MKLTRDNLFDITGYYINETGYNSTYLYKDDEKTNILDLEKFDKITEIDSFVFSEIWNLEKVILPKNLISIEKNAFQECKKLSSVIFPDTLEIIHRNAFYFCNLQEFVAPKSLRTIEASAFYNNNIQKLVLNNKIEYIYANAFKLNRINTCILPDSTVCIFQSFLDTQKMDEKPVIICSPEIIDKYFSKENKDYEIYENSLDNLIKFFNFKEINNITKIKENQISK